MSTADNEDVCDHGVSMTAPCERCEGRDCARCGEIDCDVHGDDHERATLGMWEPWEDD